MVAKGFGIFLPGLHFCFRFLSYLFGLRPQFEGQGGDEQVFVVFQGFSFADLFSGLGRTDLSNGGRLDRLLPFQGGLPFWLGRGFGFDLQRGFQSFCLCHGLIGVRRCGHEIHQRQILWRNGRT